MPHGLLFSTNGAFCRMLLPVVLIMSICGCAIHHFDPVTGTERMWGFGYLKMQVLPTASSETSPAGHQTAELAYATGVRSLGVQVGAGRDLMGVTAGWSSRSRLTIKAENSSFSIAWPTNSIWLPGISSDFFNTRIGTNFPHAPLTHKRP